MLPTDIAYLGGAIVLAIVQIMAAAIARTRETGLDQNMGPRDAPGPPVGKITGRLQRAQANLLETLPLFVGAVLAVHVAGREGALTAWGSGLYFWARIVYVPLYAFGVPVARTLAFAVSVAGLCLVLMNLFGG